MTKVNQRSEVYGWSASTLNVSEPQLLSQPAVRFPAITTAPLSHEPSANPGSPSVTADYSFAPELIKRALSSEWFNRPVIR